MQQRRWSLLVLILLIAVSGGIWWWQQPRATPLIVEYHGQQALDSLLLHGDGLVRHALIQPVAPDSQVGLRLLPRRHGELRIQVRQGQQNIDARLLADVATLRQQPMKLVVGPGQRYVLVPLPPAQP